MTFKNIVVLGATGNLGPHVVNVLLATKEYTVTVVTSKKAHDATKSDHVAKGAHIRHGHFNDLSTFSHIFANQDVVVSLVGRAVWDKQSQLADIAAQAGVKRFIPSDFGINLSDPRVENVLTLKTAVHAHLKELASQGKLEYTLVYNGAFLDWGIKSGFLKIDLANKKVTLIDEGKHLFTASTLEDVGHFVAAVLKHPEESRNKALNFASVTVTQQQIVDELEKQTGTKFEVAQRVTSAELAALSKESLAKGDFVGYVTNWLWAVIFDGRQHVEHLDNGPLGVVKTESLEAGVKKALQ